MFMDSVSCGILNGLGKQSRLLIFSLTDNFIRLALIFFLVPKFGVDALFFIIIVSNLFTSSLTIKTVTKLTKVSFQLSGWFFKHLSAAVLTFAVFFILSPAFLTTTPFQLAWAISFTILLYLLLGSVLSKTLRQDIKWLSGRMFLNI